MTNLTVSFSEYMQTTYRPDCEYIDGELRERNAGFWEHARLQLLLAAWQGDHEAEWNITGSMAQRVQVTADRVRVPDLVVLRPGVQPPVLVEPPLLVIEILSPGDRYSELEERCRDYQRMGVTTM